MTGFRSNALIAMGSNLSFGGHSPQHTLRRAIVKMPGHGLMIRAISRFFTTPCFPAGAGPDYVNAVVRVASDLEPQALLAALHLIEHQFGRIRDQRWGMRTLDLDLLAVDQCVLPDTSTHRTWRDLPAEKQAVAAPDQLILPHPRLQDRAFVLVPMCDVAPDWIHPVLGKSTAAMCAALPRQEVEMVHPI